MAERTAKGKVTAVGSEIFRFLVCHVFTAHFTPTVTLEMFSGEGAPEAAAIARASSRLVGVDWSLGVSASSSELQALGTTFVILRLHTESDDGTSEYIHLGARCSPQPRAPRRRAHGLTRSPPSLHLRCRTHAPQILRVAALA